MGHFLPAASYPQIYGLKTAALAQLGRVNEARLALTKFNQHFPGETLQSFRRHFRWKKLEDIDHYMNGLRKAGLPDS